MEETTPDTRRIGVFCIGNELLLDEGIGPAAARKLNAEYTFPAGVDVMDRGVMGFALIGEFQEYDYLMTVDAVDGTGEEPGTVFRYSPDDLKADPGNRGAHDTRLSDVLMACELLGCHLDAECIGMQVENMSPDQMVIGLTPKVEAALPLLCETVLAALWQQGVRGIVEKATGREVRPPEGSSL